MKNIIRYIDWLAYGIVGIVFLMCIVLLVTPFVYGFFMLPGSQKLFLIAFFAAFGWIAYRVDNKYDRIIKRA